MNVGIGRHVTMCAACSRFWGDTAKVCDTGWELLKAQTRARNAVHRAEVRELERPEQGTLW